MSPRGVLYQFITDTLAHPLPSTPATVTVAIGAVASGRVAPVFDPYSSQQVSLVPSVKEGRYVSPTDSALEVSKLLSWRGNWTVQR